MKAIRWCIVLAIAFGPVISWAQEKPAPPPERSGGQVLERIRYSLGDLKLSEEQKTKVDQIFRKARQEMDALRQELQSLEQRERGERVGEFFRDVREQLAQVLSDEQRAILDKRLDAARENVRNRFGGPPAPAPATAPARPTAPAPARPGEPQRPGAVLERLREVVQKLDLTDAQKQQIKTLVEDVQSRGAALRQQAEAGVEDARIKARDLMQETRRRVDEILTPAQRERLRDMLGERAAPATQQAMMMGEDEEMMMAGGERGTRAKKPAAAPSQLGDPGKAPVGSEAPPLALKKLDGALVQLSALKGRVVVLEFGSWTCPIFRERAAAMEKLRSDYSTRAQFFIVYTREAHAKDEWEVARNRSLQIVVEQPRSMDARAALAKKTRDELKLGTPIILDTMDNQVATAYGAGPNSAFVINRDGRIVARQQWFDPAGLRRAIDEAIKATPSPAAAAQ